MFPNSNGKHQQRSVDARDRSARWKSANLTSAEFHEYIVKYFDAFLLDAIDVETIFVLSQKNKLLYIQKLLQF